MPKDHGAEKPAPAEITLTPTVAALPGGFRLGAIGSF
jgi:hypothetical protein